MASAVTTGALALGSASANSMTLLAWYEGSMLKPVGAREQSSPATDNPMRTNVATRRMWGTVGITTLIQGLCHVSEFPASGRYSIRWRRARSPGLARICGALNVRQGKLGQ